MVVDSIRFACGALFGAVVALWLVFWTNSVAVFASGLIAGGVTGGYLAVKLGRRFWEWVRHLQWFVP
jgi:hypothetical protein